MSTAIVAVTLVGGAVVFALVLRGVLLEEVHTALDRDLEQIETELDTGNGLGGLDADDDDVLFQITDAAGTLLAGSEALEGVAAGDKGAGGVGDLEEHLIVVGVEAAHAAAGVEVGGDLL